MQFIPHVLPQLAVSAKLLCLLMVVICGAVPSMVCSVKLFSGGSSKFVTITDSGQVHAAGDENDSGHYLNLTIASIDFTKLSIYSERTRRYICFNKRWKLIGMPEKRNPRTLARCQFLEEINSLGYSTYRSIANDSHYLAFNSRGKPVRRHPIKGYGEKCRNFLKIGGFDIGRHNNIMSNGNPPRSAHLHNSSQQSRQHKKRHKFLKTRK